MEICQKLGVKPSPPISETKVGIALDTIGKLPINGIRHAPENGTNGWYFWCGETLSSEQDFFSPLHTEHLDKYLPQVIKYLDLPPGYRFLIDDAGYEDIWFDKEL